VTPENSGDDGSTTFSAASFRSQVMSSDKKTKDVTVSLTGVQAVAKVGRLAAKGITRGARRRKGKYEYEVLKGNEFNSAGHMMRKERIIDRQNDRYIENVIDEDTGETVRQIDEPLSQHMGRGSAKSKKKET